MSAMLALAVWPISIIAWPIANIWNWWEADICSNLLNAAAEHHSKAQKYKNDYEHPCRGDDDELA